MRGDGALRPVRGRAAVRRGAVVTVLAAPLCCSVPALAAPYDGAVALTVEPATVPAGSPAADVRFTLTAQEGFRGELRLTLPPEWTAPTLGDGPGSISVDAGACALQAGPSLLHRTVSTTVSCPTDGALVLRYRDAAAPVRAGGYPMSATARPTGAESTGDLAAGQLIVVAGPLTELRFVAAPRVATAGQPLRPAPWLVGRDAHGNPAGAGAAVRLDLLDRTGRSLAGAGLVLDADGSTPPTDLVAGTPTTGAVLRAVADGAEAISAAFDVTAPPRGQPTRPDGGAGAATAARPSGPSTGTGPPGAGGTATPGPSTGTAPPAASPPPPGGTTAPPAGGTTVMAASAPVQASGPPVGGVGTAVLPSLLPFGQPGTAVALSAASASRPLAVPHPLVAPPPSSAAAPSAAPPRVTDRLAVVTSMRLAAGARRPGAAPVPTSSVEPLVLWTALGVAVLVWRRAARPATAR
jgi:hypothetical protein